jgi:LPS export ABC transporter protein LptC
VPLSLTRKQSIWLGLGLLGLFFVASAATIYRRNQVRVPSSSSLLTKERVEGAPSNGGKAPAEAINPTGNQTPAPANGLGFVLNDFHRSLVRDGKTVWEIRGTRGQYNALQNSATIAKPDLTVNRENGDRVTLTAERAELGLSGTQLNTAELFDNVVAIYKGDTTIKTTYAKYKESEGRVEVPVPVELDSPMFALKGNKLVALLDAQQVYITGGVTSVIKPRAPIKRAESKLNEVKR